MKGLDIQRRRMGNSGLTGSPSDAPDEVVHRLGAMQAQDYGPAKWSIGQRADNLRDEDLDGALAAGSILRTHVLRPTWHFVARDDIRWLLELTGPRVHRHNRPRFRGLGLDEHTLGRCEALIVAALQDGNHLPRDAIASVLDAAGLDRSGQRLAHILMHCELEGTICSGVPAGKRQTYSLLDERAPAGSRFDREEALVELTRRYLRSHGPATVQDFSWWSSLALSDIKNALHTLGSEVEKEEIDDMTFWSSASDASRPPSGRGAHLLQAYDELLVGYTQSRYFGDPRAPDARAAWRDRSLPNGVFLLNGGVAGHWRRTIQKGSVTVEVLAYEDPEPDDVKALQAAAADLGRFLRRGVIVETRVL